MTVHRPDRHSQDLWIHPGEPLFGTSSPASVVGRFGIEGLKGSAFVDPYATEPYLFHIALVTVEQDRGSTANESGAYSLGSPNGVEQSSRMRESRVVGLRQESDGTVSVCPVEHLLLLRGVKDFAPGREPLAALARSMIGDADTFAMDVVTSDMVQRQRRVVSKDLDERLRFISLGFDYQMAELTEIRTRLREKEQLGDATASKALASVRERQRGLSDERHRRLAAVRAEPDSIMPGDVKFLVHSLVLPSQEPDDVEAYGAEVESVAMSVAIGYEKGFGARVHDVSRPDLARLAGLSNWPGFDLLSLRTDGASAVAQKRCIEVKGRRGDGSIQLRYNECVKACNLGEDYWLYVVFGCATPNPRLVRVQDPFNNLVMKSYESTAYTITQTEILNASE